MITIKNLFICIALFYLTVASNTVFAKENNESMEILHWWTAPGEAKAIKTLKSALDKKSIFWSEFAILGEGGSSAMRVLQMRALAGNPPETAQIKGPDIGE